RAEELLELLGGAGEVAGGEGADDIVGPVPAGVGAGVEHAAARRVTPFPVAVSGTVPIAEVADEVDEFRGGAPGCDAGPDVDPLAVRGGHGRAGGSVRLDRLARDRVPLLR